MLINLRNALMAGKRLPYDAEVEYLQSDGNAYINTGIAPAPNMDYSITFSAQNASTYYRIFGAWTASNQKRFGAIVNAQNILYQQMTPHGEVLSNYISPNVVTIEKRGLACYVNGVYVNSFSSDIDAGEITDNLLAFAINISGSAIAAVSGLRIYSFSLTLNGVLIRDFIPVRKGTVGYLYDRVSGKLFGNAGTGDFVLGPDVVPVEYIESHAAEYIDTGAIPDDSTGIEVVHTICPDNNKDNIIFGARQDSGDTRYWSDIDWGANDNVGWGFNTYSGSSERFALASSDVGRVITNSLNYMNDRAGKIDGVTYDSSLQSKTLATINRNIYLFGANNMGTIAVRGTFKVYSAKISKGQTLVNKFRPVRVGTDATSWEGAMMDVLTRRIYRNAGTGAFTYGNDLKYPIPA